MTQRNDDPSATPQPAPSWVDEVLRAQSAPHTPTPLEPPAGAAQDLRLSDLYPSEGPRPEPQPAPEAYAYAERDPWAPMSEVPGGAPYAASAQPQWPVASPSYGIQHDPYTGLPSDTGQKKLIAGLLAIVFGALGVHKFYLGLNTPGAIVLGAQVGGWILAFFLGLITFGMGLFVTIPLAILCSTALGVLGLIEGILYLTKSDEDFHRQYVLGRRPLL